MIEYEKFFNYSLDLFVIAGADGYFKRVNPAFCNLLGYTEADLLSKPYSSFIHPDDIYKVDQALKSLNAGHPAFLVELRLLAEDGTYRLLLWSGYPDLEAGLIFAIAKDQTLQDPETRQIRLLLDSSPTAVFLVEKSGTITYANQLADRIFGYRRNELIGRSIEALVPPRFRKKHIGHITQYMEKPRLRTLGSIVNLAGYKKNKEEIPLDIGLNPVWLSSGMIIICSVINAGTNNVHLQNLIEEKKNLEKSKTRLERLANRDTLTGLLNRRAFERTFVNDLSSARKSGKSISIISVDLDRFKEYNDRNGHLAGDALLKKFGEVLIKNVRRGDSAARVGGDEFIIILPDDGYDQAVNFGNRFHRILRKHKSLGTHVTISMGASTYVFRSKRTELKRIMKQLLSEADKALYHSKNAGPDLFTHFEDISSNSNA